MKFSVKSFAELATVHLTTLLHSGHWLTTYLGRYVTWALGVLKFHKFNDAEWRIEACLFDEFMVSVVEY